VHGLGAELGLPGAAMKSATLRGPYETLPTWTPVCAGKFNLQIRLQPLFRR
jgi:hypothetical protein